MAAGKDRPGPFSASSTVQGCSPEIRIVPAALGGYAFGFTAANSLSSRTMC
jgi:hypothetical protein